MYPDKKTNEKAENRRNELAERAIRAADVVVRQCGQIDAHECDQRAEVQQLSAPIIAHEKRTNENYNADKQHIIGRDASLRMDSSEKFSGKSVAASHAVKQTRRAELRSHTGTDRGDKQGHADQLGHENAAGNSGHVTEDVFVSELREDAKVFAEMLKAE